MNYTNNLNLKRPGYSDPADIQDINDNMDIIDQQINNLDTNKADKAQPNWIVATLQNGWIGNLFYRKNQLGQLEMMFNPLTAGTVSDFTTITTFPDGYIPGAHSPVKVYNNSTGETVIGMVVLATGEFKIRTPATTKISTGQEISTHTFY